jgi:hypothetical protein
MLSIMHTYIYITMRARLVSITKYHYYFTSIQRVACYHFCPSLLVLQIVLAYTHALSTWLPFMPDERHCHHCAYMLWLTHECILLMMNALMTPCMYYE